MSATVHYACDRCAAAGTVPAIDGQPTPIPERWTRMAVEGRPILHMCPECAPALDAWLTLTAPGPEVAEPAGE